MRFEGRFAQLVRLALTLTLASYLCVPASAFAAPGRQGDSGGMPLGIQFGALVAETDLNAAWNAQGGGLSSTYTIRKGGSYFLSADLKAESNLVVDAPGEDVTIRFDGHVLTLNGSGSSAEKTMLSIVAAQSVRLDGASSVGKSALASAGENDVWGIASSADGCAVSMNDLTVTLEPNTGSQRYLSTHAIRIDGGSLSLTNCTVNMLMGAQTLSSLDIVNDTGEPPSAVFATARTSFVALYGCTVIGEGSQALSCDVNDTTSLGNAYAVYSRAGFARITGGMYTATSLRGNATCLSASDLLLTTNVRNPSIALEANAGQIASGVLSSAVAEVEVDAPISFSPSEDYEGYAAVVAAFRSQVDGGFAFGSCAPAGNAAYPTLVMRSGEDLGSANADGAVIGSFEASLSADQRADVLVALENALGAGSSVVADSRGDACFAFDSATEDGATARIGDAYYPTLPAALAAFSNGDTLTLLRDAGALEVSRANGGTIDLNGHEVASFAFSGAAGGVGLVVKNGIVGGTQSVYGRLVGVYQNSESPLALSGVSVRIWGCDASVYGVYAGASKGAITLNGGSSVNVIASQTSKGAGAYGVYVEQGNARSRLFLEDADVDAATGSAGVPVYGVSCGSGADVARCRISARGTDATTGALFALGDVDLSGVKLEAFASGASPSCFGIYGRSLAKADITVDACSIRVCSLGSAAGLPCACLLGETNSYGESTATWSLSGELAFTAEDGAVMGSRLGSVALASDFSLAPESDDVLVVSQVEQADDVGFTVEGAPASDWLSRIVRVFSAQAGSYYDGCDLVADAGASRLVWRSHKALPAAFSLMRGGSVKEAFNSLSEALSVAESGDILRLEGDHVESGVQAVDQDDLTIDLNGHALVVRAGGVGVSMQSGTYDALRYSGAGTLTVKNGTLGIQLGVANELYTVRNIPYEGIAVTGGGTLSIASDAHIDVSYVGGTSATAANQQIALRGIAVTDGSVDLKGALRVSGAPSDGVNGAMTTHGVLSRSDAECAVSIARGALVDVDAGTSASTTNNAYHAETTTGSTTNDGPRGLRELDVDPVNDEQLYQDIVDQFRLSATYDDPNENTGRTTSGFAQNLGLYYAHDMQIHREGAWYDGLRIWAYSDVVPTSDVGKLSAIVPAHVFTSASYDELPEAYGVATTAGTTADAGIVVKGSVSARASHGNAYALFCAGSARWACEGADLSAVSDDQVHLLAQGKLDLRDYVKFSSEQSKALAYSGASVAQVVKFGCAIARDIVVGESASLSLAGVSSFSASGGDVAHVQADSFSVVASFSLADDSTSARACTVLAADGENERGAVFAQGARADQVVLFEDAHRALIAGATSEGAAWTADCERVVTFQIGDAVVARYAAGDAVSIDLAEPTAAAERASDQRQDYRLVGWSVSRDENATGGYVSPSASVAPVGDAVYYAVYETSLTRVPVRFTNIFGATGALQPDVVLDATYGLSVADALAAADVSLPRPESYDADGLSYRFVGWYPYSSSDASGAWLYDAAKLSDLDITLSVNGVSAGELVLRAVYVATLPTQHVVTFDVDGFTSACVVDDGQRPFFTAANKANSNYASPAKQVGEAGKVFSFKRWFVDDDGDGSRDDGEKAYSSVLPAATEDARYCADWMWKWADLKLTLFVKYYDEASDSLVTSGTRVFDTTCERGVAELAESVVKAGDVFGYGGKVYTFKGWSPRKTDVEAVYADASLLPELGIDERALSSAYAKTYYGVYAVSDHKVNVTFRDGGATLGSAPDVLAIGTSVERAFAATGAVKPSDKSSAQAFLGWAIDPNAASALDGASTMVEDLVGYADTSLVLHAVYGPVPSYTVRLRNEDGSAVLYQVGVKRGDTVASTLAAAGAAVQMAPQEGRYFSGWRTAAGEFYSLDTPVTGSANLYARYGDVSVTTSDANEITAAVTLSTELYSSLGLSRELTGMSFSVTPQSAPDSPLRFTTAEKGYTVLKSFTMKLAATYATGETELRQGDIGAVAVSVCVGDKYKDAKVRLFWLGLDGAREVVLNSDVKSVGADGRVSAVIGNYGVGDEGQGGNLVVAYVEGGVNDDALKTTKDSSSVLKKKTAESASDGLQASSSGLPGLSGAGLVGLSAPGGPSSLSPSGSPGGPTPAGKGGGAFADEGADAKAGVLPDGAWESDGAEGGEPEGDAEQAASPFSDLDSDGVVLLVFAVGVLAAAAIALWRLLVVRPRLAEAGAELPAMGERYAEGLRF